MKKTKILSGASSLIILLYISFIEVGLIVLCSFYNRVLAYIGLAVWSVYCIAAYVVYNRIVTIVTYDPEKEIVTRRGFLGGFYRELRVADIIRTEIRMIHLEQEYILLIDKEVPPYVGSLSRDMPIRVPNTEKGRAFIANFIAPDQYN